MPPPQVEQLRQAFVEEITEVLIRLMHQGYTLQEIEFVAYKHFENRTRGLRALPQRPG